MKKKKDIKRTVSQLDTKKIMRTDNDKLESLSYEEQQWLKEYQIRMFEKELRNNNISY